MDNNNLNPKISKPQQQNPLLQSQMLVDQPNLQQPQSQSQQPPVYNINKNDFRDVVQKLTGSPSHFPPAPTPAPLPTTRPPSSRLQKIRPPPLPLPPPQPQSQPPQPFLLPPLPSVHTSAESPISAYMRFIQNSSTGESFSTPPTQVESPVTAYMRFLHNSAAAAAGGNPNANAAMWNVPLLPLSPLPFGCGDLLSPGFMMSPPLSPTPPVSGPGWNGI